MNESLESVDPDIRRIRDARDPEVNALVSRSDSYLDSLYPPESNHAESAVSLLSQGAAFFGGYVADTLVACGAVKIETDCDHPYGEIKRLFVDPDHRSAGLASALMAHLEQLLRTKDIGIARIEVGVSQPEALGLYRKLGYAERGPFGRYKSDPLSVFLEKKI